jgi:hypothetical protein
MLLAFDMWEARFRATVSFYEVTAAEQVSLLGDALEGPALRFYYKEIVPDTARAGGGAHPGSAADPATNLSPNVMSLSQAVVEPPQNWRLYQPCLYLRCYAGAICAVGWMDLTILLLLLCLTRCEPR